jgi:hypothetical protein
VSNVQNKENLFFTADSGYINKPLAQQLLLKLKDKDSINLTAGNYKENDTLGKYYRMSNGNYMAFINDFIHPQYEPSQLLGEFTPSGKLLKNDRCGNGMYLCCWKSSDDGFKKKGNYFYIKSCGTGSGYCSGHITLFTSLNDYNTESILEQLWASMCVGEFACSLTSAMEIKSDTVIMHYTLKKIDRMSEKTKLTDKFEISYIRKNEQWMATDSTMIKDLGYIFED